MFQWIFSGMFQHIVTFQRYVQKDCHFPSGFVLELSNGLSDFWCSVIFCPNRVRQAVPPEPSQPHISPLSLYIYIYIHVYILAYYMCVCANVCVIDVYVYIYIYI